MKITEELDERDPITAGTRAWAKAWRTAGPVARHEIREAVDASEAVQRPEQVLIAIGLAAREVRHARLVLKAGLFVAALFLLGAVGFGVLDDWVREATWKGLGTGLVMALFALGVVVNRIRGYGRAEAANREFLASTNAGFAPGEIEPPMTVKGLWRYRLSVAPFVALFLAGQLALRWLVADEPWYVQVLAEVAFLAAVVLITVLFTRLGERFTAGRKSRKHPDTGVAP